MRYLNCAQDKAAGTVVTTVLDTLTNQELSILSIYVAGADGARSELIRQLDLPMTELPSGGIAWNVLVEAEMSHLVEHSMGMIHVLVQPEKEYPDFAKFCAARMVKPWHEWLFVFLPAPWERRFEATEVNWKRRTEDFIGDRSVKVTIKGISRWRINESYAKIYSKGNV